MFLFFSFFHFFLFSLLCLVFFPLNLIWSCTVWFGLFHSISHCTSLSPCIENKGFSPRNYLLIMHRNVVGIISECLPIEVFTQWKTFNTWKEWTLVIASKQPNSPHISISKWKNLHMLGLSYLMIIIKLWMELLLSASIYSKHEFLIRYKYTNTNTNMHSEKSTLIPQRQWLSWNRPNFMFFFRLFSFRCAVFKQSE